MPQSMIYFTSVFLYMAQGKCQILLFFYIDSFLSYLGTFVKINWPCMFGCVLGTLFSSIDLYISSFASSTLP